VTQGQQLQLGVPSELTDEEHRSLLEQTKLRMLTDEQYLELMFRDGLEEEALVADAEESFRVYAKMMWPVMEAGQPMTVGWATDAICDHLQAVTENEIQNLAIFVPPGMAKSFLTCLYWPTWEWGPRRMPHLRYITASYSEDLTLATNRLSRALIDSDTFVKWWRRGKDGKDLWGIDPKQDTKTEFATTKMGFRFATSTGGTITGKRGHRLIFDDLHSAAQAESDLIRTGQVTWFRESAMNRVVDAHTKRILIMQLLHAADVGSVAAELGWTVLCLPMRYEHDHPKRWVGGPLYAELSGGRRRLVQWGKGDPRKTDGELVFPERFPEDMVADLEESMGDYAVAGQFQQRPSPRGGASCDVEKLEYIQAWDVPEDIRWSRGWDLASSKKKTSAFTANIKVGIGDDGYVYVDDGWMDRYKPDELEKALVAKVEGDGPGVRQSLPQDPAQAGAFQAHVLAGLLHGYVFDFSLESGSKDDRFKPFAAQVNAGRVRVVIGPWVQRPSPMAYVPGLKTQLAEFPRGKFRDLTDAISRGYMDAVMGRTFDMPVPGAPKAIIRPWKVEQPYRTR
jgi:hypothetical protein